jgi:hypothetical protein
MDPLRAGESMITSGATVTNMGAGMYRFTPRELTAAEQEENERRFNAWLESFNAAYMAHYGEPCSAYLQYKEAAGIEQK